MLAWILQEGLHVDTNTSTETRMLTFNLQFIKDALCLLFMLEDYFGLKTLFLSVILFCKYNMKVNAE